MALQDLLQDRILILDGAMGTAIQAHDLEPSDFGGPALDGCNEHLTRTRPDVIRGIHEAHLEAGADIIETNTFGATRIVLDEYDLGPLARELNREAAQLAREAADAYTTPGKPRFVAGSIGPTTRALTVTGGVTFTELQDAYREQALGLLEGGVDALLVETTQDTLNLKAASLGIETAQEELDRHVPLMLSCTIEPTGTMLGGQPVEAFWASVEHLNPLTVGLNCATGPEFMTDHVRSLSDLAPTAIAVYPNAGLPNEDGSYPETPTSLAEKMTRFVEEGWVNVVGGCCGTTPKHIEALTELVEDHAPRPLPGGRDRIRHVSGLDHLEIDPANRPYLIGERTNVIGSRGFKERIQEGAYEAAAEIGRDQVRGGAHMLDVCLADPDRDEARDTRKLLEHLRSMVKAPLVIDSTDADVIELALRMTPGKCIVNSINLEDGLERFQEVVPLLKRYGAAVIVGCIDEEGMARTVERKLEVARRSHRILTEEWGIPAEDIIFDPLVFPCATGDEDYEGTAIATLDAVEAITEAFPRCTTVLGVSNVSFGLPPAGREVLNSVFLHRAVARGLTMAIVNTQGIRRYPSIPQEERDLCDAILQGSAEAVEAFTAHFRDRDPTKRKSGFADLPLEERIARRIVEGTKQGLTEDLTRALETYEPLEVINGPLMEGMAEVGQLFNDNELIVAEVLRSAEAMKAAVSHLEPHMDRADTATKGKVLLATVKGDVHDIGKNLVDIILTNNGYDVVNLGIKVPPETLIQAVREHDPDLLGLSGLLVKSARQMVRTVTDLREAGVDVPVLVGGAALSKRFTATRIAPEYPGPTVYARDAMQGLDLSNQLVSADREHLLERTREEYAEIEATGGGRAKRKDRDTSHEPLSHTHPVPQPPDLQRHEVHDVPLREVWAYVNPTMLYSKHLGLRGRFEQLLEEGDGKAQELHRVVEALKSEVIEQDLMQPRGVYRFLPAHGDGDDVVVYDPKSLEGPGDPEVLEVFEFERQDQHPRRCLADWVRPRGRGEMDHIALFTVTAGQGIREQANAWKEEGEYLKSHALQALALETAEGFAELLHEQLRADWGFPDPPDLTKRDLFRANYRGRRVSFGYPACPNLEDQRKLFTLLEPETIGVDLTEGYMMDPEASVSALVFHHPEAVYFNVRDAREG